MHNFSRPFRREEFYSVKDVLICVCVFKVKEKNMRYVPFVVSSMDEYDFPLSARQLITQYVVLFSPNLC